MDATRVTGTLPAPPTDAQPGERNSLRPCFLSSSLVLHQNFEATLIRLLAIESKLVLLTIHKSIGVESLHTVPSARPVESVEWNERD
jgi:hypothetical protein